MLLEEVIGVGLWELTLALYTMSPYAARQLQSESWAGQEQKKKRKKKTISTTDSSQHVCQPCHPGPARGSWQESSHCFFSSLAPSPPVLVIRSISCDSSMALHIFTGDSLVIQKALLKKTPKHFKYQTRTLHFQCISSFTPIPALKWLL